MIKSGEWNLDLVPVCDIKQSSLPVIKAVMMDGCQKLNRLAGMGASYAEVSPVLTTYLGAPHQEVLQHVQGGGSGAAAAHDDGGEAGMSCHPNLRCARDYSRVGAGVLDYHGVMGAVCCHGFPLVGCFVAMPAPEQYLYYDTVLSHVLRRARVVDCYIDFACQYKRNLGARLQARGVCEGAAACTEGLEGCFGLASAGTVVQWTHLCALAKHTEHQCTRRRWRRARLSCSCPPT